MTITFRELTNQECALNRDQLSSEPKRSVLECQVLSVLDAAKAAFKGPIKVVPIGVTAEQAKGGLQGPTASQREAIEKRIRESGGVVR